mmetsp:Transcript_23798/g.52731  ORF Transcript_23798/g.52731 Transcript_23798/m.52731 type:complete len:280 (-) Transcript_23798:105-944(-)
MASTSTMLVPDFSAGQHQQHQQLAENDHDEQQQQQQQQQPQLQQEIILDSLPYTDYSHPDYEAYAASLIEEEMTKFQPHPDTASLSHLGPDPLGHEPKFGAAGRTSGSSISINSTEYAALVRRNGASRPPTGADSSYVPPPPHAVGDLPPLSTDIISDEDKLRNVTSQAKVYHETQRIRLTNLELQSEFESDIWRHSNSGIESGPIMALQAELSEQRGRVDDVNARRKTMQEEDGAPKLHRLETRWQELVGNGLRLRDATRLLEEEVERLKKEAGEREE